LFIFEKLKSSWYFNYSSNEPRLWISNPIMEMDLDGLASLAVQDELELLLRGSIRVTQASANAEGILKLYASLMDQMQRFYGVNGRMIYFNGYEIPNDKQITP
jgi:hypothetical protein